MDIAGRIRGYIVQGYLDGELSIELELDTPLLELNIIDSFSVLDLVNFIHEEFQLVVPIDAVRPENFASIVAIAGLVESLSRRKEEP